MKIIVILLFCVSVFSQEDIPFGVIEKSDNDGIFQNAGDQQCDTSRELPTFIRIGNVKKDGLPRLIRKLDSLASCVGICRSNLKQAESKSFDCQGFGIVGSGLDKQCEFFDSEADEALRPVTNIEIKSTYFEKQCLAIPGHCIDAAFSFELQIDKSLLVTPTESIIVDDRKRCLNLCLSNPNCHSVNYNRHNGSCQILDKTRRSVVGGLTDLIGSEHYENTCVQGLFFI